MAGRPGSAVLRMCNSASTALCAEAYDKTIAIGRSNALNSVRLSVKLWPLNLVIIDWEKVDELIQASEKADSDGDQAARKA